jgi:hypothetical protein
MRGRFSGDVSVPAINTPMLGMLLTRWARAEIGHTATAPNVVMKSRRLI